MGATTGPLKPYHDSYVTLKLGVSCRTTAPISLDTGISIRGALGHNLNRNFALEVGLDYTVADLDETYDYYDEAVDEYDESYVSTLGIPVTARFIVPRIVRSSSPVRAWACASPKWRSSRSHDWRYPYSDNDRDPPRLPLVGADVELMNNAAVTMGAGTPARPGLRRRLRWRLRIRGTTASSGIKLQVLRIGRGREKGNLLLVPVRA